MKTLIIITALALGGCSTQRFLCTGTGTCDVPYTASHGGSLSQASSRLPSQVLLPSGNYLIVPNHSRGGISAVIRTSRTK